MNLDKIESLIAEGCEIRDGSPSKDSRAFAKKVVSCLEEIRDNEMQQEALARMILLTHSTSTVTPRIPLRDINY